MIITIKKLESIIPQDEVDKFIAKLKKGTEFSIRETNTTTSAIYERAYIK